MKAAWYDRYGPPEVVTVREVQKPEPGKGELLVRVRAATVSAADRRIRAADFPAGFVLMARAMFGFFRPRRHVLGVDLAGEVEAVGEGVEGFAAGDRVLAFPGTAMGGHAEYARVKARGAVAKLPKDMDFKTAAALAFGGCTALYFLRDRAQVKAGEKVLVVGASGAVGSAAVQIARHLGADVTGVASSANRELVEGLGAKMLAYDEGDPLSVPNRYDVVFDTIGKAAPFALAEVTKSGGRLALAVADMSAMLGARRLARRQKVEVITGTAPERAEDLSTLIELARKGALKPVIDSTYPLARIAEAHARADTGRKRGNVVVTMG